MKLSDVCTKGTSNIAQKDLDARNGTYPIYGASGFIKNVDFYHQEKPYIAIVKDGAGVGRVMQLPAKSSVIGTMQYIIPKEGVSVEYLAYALEHMNLSKYYLGAAIPHIYFKDYCNESLPNYTPEEQARISQILGVVCNLISLRKQQLAKLDQLVKSRFIEMFGDPITNSKCLPTNNLGKVLLLKAGDFTAASDIAADPTTENIYPCYGGNGIRGYVAEYNQEGSYSLIGRQGALSGNVQYATGKFKNTEHALLVTPLIEMNSVWLNHLLINLDLQRYQTGAAQPGLSVKNLQEIPIIEVPKEDQNQFADFVKQTDKSKLAIQQSLEQLEILKKSLMQKYFG